jgi:hypothetical protein
MLRSNEQSLRGGGRHRLCLQRDQGVFRRKHLPFCRPVAPDPHSQHEPGQRGQESENLQPPRNRTSAKTLPTARRGQPARAEGGQHGDNRQVQAVVEDDVRSDCGESGQGSRGQTQIHALRQQSVSRCFPGETEDIPPSCDKVDGEEPRAQNQADPTVFDEQLQPIAVRMDRIGGEAQAAVAPGQIFEGVCSRAEDRVEGEHGGHGDAPEVLPVFVHRQLLEPKPYGHTFVARGDAQTQGGADQHQGPRGQEEAMADHTALNDKEAGQSEDDHTRGQSQISRAGQADDHADESGGRGPEEEQLDPDRAAPPNQQPEGEESGHLQDAGQSGAGMQRPRDQPEIGHRLFAVRQAQLPGYVSQWVERHFRRELGHREQDLAGGEEQKDTEQQPAWSVAAQMPSRREIHAEGTEQQPGILARGVGVETLGLAPEKVPGQGQSQARAKGAGRGGNLPTPQGGDNGRQSDQPVAGNGQPRIPPATEENLGAADACSNQDGCRPVGKPIQHWTKKYALPVPNSTGNTEPPHLRDCKCSSGRRCPPHCRGRRRSCSRDEPWRVPLLGCRGDRWSEPACP